MAQSQTLSAGGQLDYSTHMRTIRSRNTKPEMIVRRLTHRLGYRFRLHRRDLPGSPDLVFPTKRKAIFVHGCFWHRHNCTLGQKTPGVRPEYWLLKFERNQQRDAANLERLTNLGWSALILWECEITRPSSDALARTIVYFLGTRADQSAR